MFFPASAGLFPLMWKLYIVCGSVCEWERLFVFLRGIEINWQLLQIHISPGLGWPGVILKKCSSTSAISAEVLTTQWTLLFVSYSAVRFRSFRKCQRSSNQRWFLFCCLSENLRHSSFFVLWIYWIHQMCHVIEQAYKNFTEHCWDLPIFTLFLICRSNITSSCYWTHGTCFDFPCSKVKKNHTSSIRTAPSVAPTLVAWCSQQLTWICR